MNIALLRFPTYFKSFSFSVVEHHGHLFCATEHLKLQTVKINAHEFIVVQKVYRECHLVLFVYMKNIFL